MVSVICPFCYPEKNEVVLDNKFAYVREDKYPVSPGHHLIIPKRHIKSIFEAGSQEIGSLWDLVCKVKELLDEKYAPDGYNIGINDGSAAGQTIMHLHIHVIPRYLGDMDNPKGGVRGVIPDKQKY